MTAISDVETEIAGSNNATASCSLAPLSSLKKLDATENRSAGFDRLSLYGSDCEDDTTENDRGVGEERRSQTMPDVDKERIGNEVTRFLRGESPIVESGRNS